MPKDIRVDTSQINKVVKSLSQIQNQMPGAAMSAVNRTLDYIGTKVGRLVTADYNIKTSDVRPTLTKHKATKGKLGASIRSRGRRLTFSHFKFVRKSSGVKVKIKKKDGFKNVNTNPGAFVQLLSGHYQVMKRRGVKRYPVDVLRTISVPQMIESLQVSSKIAEEANKKLAERIEHEIQYRLKKVSK